MATPVPPHFNLLWKWDAGDFTKAAYDAYVNASGGFTLEANGRLTADDNSQDLVYTDALGVSRRMNFPINHEAPTCESDGTLTCYNVGDAGETNPHSMFRPDNFNGSFDQWYMQPNVRYRADFEFYISDTADWANQDWTIPFQLHPAGFPSGHNQQAPYNVYIRGQLDTFRCQLLGNTNNPPTNQDPWPITNTYDWAFSTGLHLMEIEWVCDFTGQNSEFILIDNDVERVRSTTATGLKYSGSSSSEARLTLAVGCYSSAQDLSPNYPSINHRMCALYRASSPGRRTSSWL